MNKLYVKDLAKKYGVSFKEIILELNKQGIETPKAENSQIPEDMAELVELFFADLYDQGEAAVSKLVEKDKRGARKVPRRAAENSGNVK